MWNMPNWYLAHGIEKSRKYEDPSVLFGQSNWKKKNVYGIQGATITQNKDNASSSFNTRIRNYSCCKGECAVHTAIQTTLLWKAFIAGQWKVWYTGKMIH